jgi:hypothetical protein
MRGPLQIPFFLLVLLTCSVAPDECFPQLPDKGVHRPLKLKVVELEGKYTIQVPDYFTAVKRREGAGAVYLFNAPSPHYTTVQVIVLPRVGIMLIDQKTGKFNLPFQCDGGLPPLTDYFQISGNRDAYYGWTVTDYAYECTMNSPCPASVPPKSRYMTQYAFAVLDDHSCLEFTAMLFGPSKSVTGFEGDGKLLRDIIVPSLSSRH